jgi:ketosteroid isomerase-like protein
VSRQNVAAAKRIYEARNRGDVEAVLDEFDPGATWEPHLATLGGRPIRGHDEIRTYLESLQVDWVGFRHEPEEFFDSGDIVVAFLQTYAQGRGSGADVEMPVAHVLRFAGGKCVGYVSYGDREVAMRIAGLKS